MIEVKIPAEIQEYKSKVIAGLSLRQLIAIGGALAVGVPVGVFGYGKISNDLLLWLVILIVVPFVGYGFLHFKGMVFEEFVKVMFNYYFLPQKRVYEDTDANLFIDLNEELLGMEIMQQRLENGEYEDEETEWR
ncbi:MAG: PrgI family protein [Oscillospiraceae bacterium]|nr:PrgI family protein [Oscillospiraceae bacterium]